MPGARVRVSAEVASRGAPQPGQKRLSSGTGAEHEGQVAMDGDYFTDRGEGVSGGEEGFG